jgi:uncharacterized membrane protein
MHKETGNHAASIPKKYKEDFTDKAFHLGLLLKGLDGLLECAGGIFLLFVRPEQINHWAQRLTEGELSRDPHDFIANHILNSAHELTGASLLFGALYLLSHGIVKLILVTAIFIVYQVYRIADQFSAGLFLLTIFDFIIIYLTQKEYRRHKDRQVKAA